MNPAGAGPVGASSNGVGGRVHAGRREAPTLRERLARAWRLLWHGPGRAGTPIGNPLGRQAERLVARTLRRGGYRILGRNLRTSIGEVDILCLDPDGRTLVVVEVKSRVLGAGKDVTPERAVDAEKMDRLRRIARRIASRNAWTDRPWRIDVVGVDWPPEGEAGARSSRARREPTIRRHEGVRLL